MANGAHSSAWPEEWWPDLSIRYQQRCALRFPDESLATAK